MQMEHRYKYIYIANILIIDILFSFYSFAHAKEWIYATPEEYLKTAKEYVMLGEQQKLNELMVEMLEKYPRNPDVLYFKAGLLFSEKKYEESKEFLDECIKINPTYANAYELIGGIYSRKGNDNLAEEYFKKAIEIDSKSLAHGSLAELYASQGKYELANKESELYFEYVKKPSQYSYIVAAYIHGALGKDEKVIEDCQKGLNVDGADPRNVDLLLTLGKTYEKLGRYQEALDTYTFAYSWHKTITAFRDGIDRVKQKLKTKQGGQ